MPALPPSLRYRAQRAWLVLNKGPEFVGALVRWQARQGLRRIGLWPRPWEAPAAFWADLRPVSGSLQTALDARRAGDLVAASRALHTHFLDDQRPKYLFSRWLPAEMAAAIPLAARSATVTAAEQAVGRTFVFRGQPPVTFSGPVDWTHRPEGNIDWMWDLNRHFYFVTLGQAWWYTGETRFVTAFQELLTDWLRQNPVSERQPNWADPFEVACRINTWLWAYHLFAPTLDAETHQAFLAGLWAHGAYLEASLELHVPNNHLLLEAKALALLGFALSEARASARWRERGLAVLLREVGRQVGADGVHAELAPHYHRLIASELLELCVALEAEAWPGRSAVCDALARMLEAERHLSRPDGHLPLFGDSAQGDPHVRFAPLAGGAAWLERPDLRLPGACLDEPTRWLVGPARARAFEQLAIAPPAPSRHFPAAGYAVLRDGWEAQALYLAFDCGPFGYPLAPGHGHADALSIEVFAHGRPLIVDAGVYSYHLGARWRNHFRSTRAHNTVTVDDLDQSELLDIARVWRPARTTVQAWVTTPDIDFIDAAHDGYRRLANPVTHRRQILFVKPAYWLIVDWLAGAGAHTFSWRFQLPPEAAPRIEADAGLIRTEAMAIVVARPPGVGVEIESAWVSVRSGHKEPAPALVCSGLATPPVRLATLICPVSGSEQPAPGLRDRTAELTTEPGVAAFEITRGVERDLVMLDIRAVASRKRLDGHETDATAAVARFREADPAPRFTWAHGGRAFAAIERQTGAATWGRNGQ